MKKTRVFWGMAVLIFILSGCFHGRQGVSVIGYRHNHVYLKKNLSYQVGELPSVWKKFNSRAKAVTFHNKDLKATIETDAFCAGYFEDISLKTLTGQLFAGMKDREVVSETEFMLDDRGALRTISTGSVDGVKMKYDSVVVKKNNCTIDFVYMSPPENFSGGTKDFENFYNGFSF